MSSGFKVTLPDGTIQDLSDILMGFSNLMKPTVINNYYIAGTTDFTSMFGIRDSIPENAPIPINTGFKVNVGGQIKDISSFFNKKHPDIYADITGSKQYDGNEPNIIPVYRVSSNISSDQVTINGEVSQTSNFQNKLIENHIVTPINHTLTSHRNVGILNDNHYNINIPGYIVHIIGQYIINPLNVSISIEDASSEIQQYNSSYTYTYSYSSQPTCIAITSISISGILENETVQLKIDSNIIINSISLGSVTYIGSETLSGSTIKIYTVTNGEYQLESNIAGIYSIDIVDNNNYNNNSVQWEVKEKLPPPPASFVSGTKVLLSDDSWIKIEDLISNDILMTVRIPTLPYTSTTPYYGTWSTSTIEGITLGTSRVIDIRNRMVNEYTLINDIVKVTEEHYIFSKKSEDSIWKFYNVSQLNIGDSILDDNLQETIITSKVIINESTLVYSFSLDVDDVYIVKGMVAHMSTL